MKKWMWIAILALLVILFSCQKQNKEELASLEKAQKKEEIFPVAQEVENKILSAISNFEKGKASEGADLLLDAILLTKPGEYMPEGFENKILSAKERFQQGNYGKAGVLISDALLLIKSGSDVTDTKEKKDPRSVEHIQRKEKSSPVAELVRNKILAAREEFKKGNADKGVELLLESLQYLSPGTD
jgi:hypothetical protein